VAKNLAIIILVLLFSATIMANTKCHFEEARNLAISESFNVNIAVFDSVVVPYKEFLKDSGGATIPRYSRGYRHIEIPIWFLDTDTCQVILVRIARKIEKGNPVLENKTSDFKVDIEEGPYGKIWNGYNTPFYISNKPSFVALLVSWLSVNQTDPIYYSPFSFKLRGFFPKLALYGLEHYQNDAQEALDNLLNRKTYSRAFPNKFLSEISEKWFGNIIPFIPFIEQSDHRWFEEFEAGIQELNPYRRTAEIIGINGNFAYNSTRSSAGAAGLMQIWPPTCENIIRKNYPEAGIPVGCGLGTELSHFKHDGHIEAIKSSIIHLDSTFKDFMNAERGTGFFGFITRNFMNISSIDDFYFKRDLSRGRTRGKDVQELQKRLNVPVDGIFGDQTKSALAKFQLENFEMIFFYLEGNPEFLVDLGERQVAAYNSNVIKRVIPSTMTYLDKWDQVHLQKRGNRLEIPHVSLAYETVMYLKIYRHIRNNPYLIFNDPLPF